MEAFRRRSQDTTNLRPALLCIREAVLQGAEGELIVAASVEKLLLLLLLLMREVIVLAQLLLPMRLTILDAGDCI